MSDESWTTPPSRADYVPDRSETTSRDTGFQPGGYAARPVSPSSDQPTSASPGQAAQPPPSYSRPATTATYSPTRSSTGTVVEPAPPRRHAVPTATPRGVRKVKLTLARLDPWSALKTSFVFGLAGLVVFLVAVSLLYGLVDAMGVLSSLRKFLNDVDTSKSGPGITAWLGFGRIFLITALLGLINVVIMTAIVTMGAFIYNVSTDVVGGVDLTFAERN